MADRVRSLPFIALLPLSALVAVPPSHQCRRYPRRPDPPSLHACQGIRLQPPAPSLVCIGTTRIYSSVLTVAVLLVLRALASCSNDAASCVLIVIHFHVVSTPTSYARLESGESFTCLPFLYAPLFCETSPLLFACLS
ncbi:hypothetical protein C8R45DRAFT_1014890 [Mycena sanguinolenta]|nr:hypothetical protein C8R45DRAFT_1032886 [Mycena sanguinolenta]KAJ6470918.1 hypothetical protein C8R45DRAFT_1014890 [Mycena sanguinolenta]